MTLYQTVLTIHLLCAAFWLGGSIYERIYIVRNMRRAAGTPDEAGLIRILLSTESVFMPNTILLLATGITLTVMSGSGWFSMSWLGFKQGVMAAIMLLFALVVGPAMKKTKAIVKQQLSHIGQVPAECRTRLNTMIMGFDLIHIGVLINVVLAAMKPF